jgi:hypothetical protein
MIPASVNRKRLRKGLVVAPVIGAALLLELTPASAASQGKAPLGLVVSVGASMSDNLAAQPSNEESGTIAHVQVVANRHDRTRRLTSDLEVNTSYQRFLDGGVSNYWSGGAFGSLLIGVIPDNFEWSVRDNFSQVRENVLEADRPSNLTSANYFTTGPTITLPLGDLTSAKLSGEYSLETYGRTVPDSERTGGTFSLVRQLNSSSVVSLNATTAKQKPKDDVVSPDFTTRSASLQYEVSNKRADLSFTAGYSEASSGQQDTGALSGALSLRRNVFSYSSITLSLARDYSNTGQSLQSQQLLGGVNDEYSSVVPASDVFLREAATLSWDLNRGRTTIGVIAGYETGEYLNFTQFDRNAFRGGLSLARRVRPSLTLQAELRTSVERFKNLNARASTIGGGLSANWQQGSQLGWTLRYDYRSSGGDGSVARFAENRIGLFLNYSPLARR